MDEMVQFGGSGAGSCGRAGLSRRPLERREKSVDFMNYKIATQIRSKMNCMLAVPVLLDTRIPGLLFQDVFVGSGKRLHLWRGRGASQPRTGPITQSPPVHAGGPPATPAPARAREVSEMRINLRAGKVPNQGPSWENGERFPVDRPFLLPALRDCLYGKPGRAGGAVLR